MLTATWRRLGSPFWLAIGLVILVPALAEAQLFPNRTIRRQKPNCASENPYYAQVRRDYFGYYPTCWRKFPDGWAAPCPNPELPNVAEAFAREPLDLKRRGALEEGAGAGDPDQMDRPDRGAPPANDPNLPQLPGTRRPFDLEDQPAPKPGVPPTTTPSPFEEPGTPAPKPAPGNTRPGSGPGPATGPGGNPPGSSSSLMPMPSLPEVSPTTGFVSPLQPGSMVLAADATLASTDSSSIRPDLGPLPSPTTPNNSGILTESDPSVTDPSPTSTPAQAPKRKSLLSSLFNRVTNRTR